MFKNSINGKRYIGSSENLRNIFLQYFNTNHLLNNQCMAIYCALIKHGYSSGVQFLNIVHLISV